MKTIKCDACGKESWECKETEVPLLTYELGDHVFLQPREIDLCPECRERIFRVMSAEYYKIAAEHNSTGLRGIEGE